MSKQDQTKTTSGAETKTPPPAYFLSVSLENVRCFGPKQTLDLSDGNGRPAQWTIILGDNGTGKTTLLQSISSLQPDKPSETGHVQPTMGMFSARRLNTGDSEVRSELTYGHKLRDKEIGDATTLDWIIKKHPVDDVFGITGTVRLNRIVGGLQCYTYGANRRMTDTGLIEEDAVVNGFLSDEHALPNAEEWMLQLDYAANRAEGTQREQATQRKKQVIDVLIHLLPDIEDIRFVEPEEGKLVPRVEFKTPYGWVRINQLSLGYRTMIAWTVDVARRLFERYPNSPNPLEEPAVVLVDEIDLHLHPRWQRDIIPFLSERFPNTQFIVTAHSPLIVQAAQEANIVLLRREGDHVVIDQDLTPIRNLRVDQILTSELYGLESARPPQLDALLEKRRTLLSKSRLTAKDREALQQIEAEIGELPAGETPAEQEAMDIIRRAAERLKQES